MRTRDEQFQWKPFLKQLAVIAIPIALQNLLTTTGTMVDTVMIASLGERVVGGVGICSQISGLLVNSFWGFLATGLLFMAQYWGAKDKEGVERAYGLMMTAMMTIGLLYTAVSVIFPEWFIGLLTDKQGIAEISVRYLKIIGFGYPMVVFTSGVSAYLRSTERIRIPLYASIMGVATNVFLNWVLIYGRFGIPALGVEGAAIATVTGNFVNLAACLIMARAAGCKTLFRIRAHFRWNKKFVKEFFQKGALILSNEVLCAIHTFIVTAIFGRQSEAAIEVVAVITTLQGIFISMFQGFSSAGSIIVGNSVGAGRLEDAYKKAFRLILVMMVVMAALSGILFLVKTPVLSTMGLEGDTLALGKQITYIFGVAMIFRMSDWVYTEMHRAGGDPITGCVSEAITMYGITVPLMLLAAYVFKLPFIFVFMARFIEDPIRWVFMCWSLLRGRWIRPVTEEGKKALPEYWKRHNIKPKIIR